MLSEVELCKASMSSATILMLENRTLSRENLEISGSRYRLRGLKKSGQSDSLRILTMVQFLLEHAAPARRDPLDLADLREKRGNLVKQMP